METHSEEVIKKLYATGHALFFQKDYSAAANTFDYLTQIHPHDKKYWLSLATAQLHSKDFKNALESYYRLNRLDPFDPGAFYFASECFIKMEDYHNAANCLKQAIEIAKENPLYKSFEKKAQLLLENIHSLIHKEKA